MQIAVIAGPTYETALTRVLLANKLRDGIELRLDLFHEFDFEKSRILLHRSTGKTIVTLRKRSAGGGFSGSEEKRLNLLLQIFSLSPDYIDLEFDTNVHFLEQVSLQYPSSKIIFSYHNFEKTPKDLDLVLERMRSPYAYAYKICTTAHATSDAYKMLRFIQKQVSHGLRVIGLAMGDYGRITRKEGIKSGNYLNYTILHQYDVCAPGIQFA